MKFITKLSINFANKNFSNLFFSSYGKKKKKPEKKKKGYISYITETITGESSNS